MNEEIILTMVRPYLMKNATEATLNLRIYNKLDSWD